MKVCFKCKKELPLSDFYKHAQMKDGRLNKCKGCAKADVAKNKLDNHDHYKEYEKTRSSLPHRVTARKDYRSTPKGKAAVYRATVRYRVTHREQYLANSKLKYAVSAGKVTPPDLCSECKTATEVQGHHDDYTKPLDVRWLCAACHKQWHRDNLEHKDEQSNAT